MEAHDLLLRVGINISRFIAENSFGAPQTLNILNSYFYNNVEDMALVEIISAQFVKEGDKYTL
jgi:hypothetical protein